MTGWDIQVPGVSCENGSFRWLFLGSTDCRKELNDEKCVLWALCKRRISDLWSVNEIWGILDPRRGLCMSKVSLCYWPWLNTVPRQLWHVVVWSARGNRLRRKLHLIFLFTDVVSSWYPYTQCDPLYLVTLGTW